MVRKYLLLALLLSTPLFADTGFKDLIQITETDNAPKCMAGQVKFSAGSVTCNGNVATVATGGTAASLPPGSSNYIQNTLTPTTATQKFSVERGTFTDNVTTPKINFSGKSAMMVYPDGSTFLSMPSTVDQFFGINTNLINTGGVFNFANGPNCLPYPGGGNFNSCVGPFGMSANVITVAENNNSMGYAACGALRGGFYNNCIGGSSGSFLRDGSYNSLQGAYAGERIIDNAGNTFSGFEAGKYQSAGDFNTGMGYHAGLGTTTIENANFLGGGNSWLGKNTGQDVSSSTVVNNSIAIGNGALVHASNQAQIGGQSGTGLEVELKVSSFTANNGWIGFASRSLNELRTTTPTAVGQSYFVTDGTMSICISTGTGRGAYASPINKATACN